MHNTLIVIPFVNNVDMTIECYSSVFNNLSVNDVIVMVSDGSRTGNIRSVARYVIQPVMVLSVDRRRGLANAWNEGMSFFLFGDFRYALFMHNDVVMGKDVLTEMRLAFDVNDNAGAVFPSQYETAGRFAEIDNPQGYCFMVKRDVIEKLGMFNDDFIIKPDLEYFRRMIDAKLKLVECRRARVEHKGGGTSSRMWSLNEYTEIVEKEMRLIQDR